MKKRFSRKLFEQNDRIAKIAGFTYLALSGFASEVKTNKNRYGTDILYKTPEGQERLLEVEVKRVWDGGPFPYDDINILYRKKKYFDDGAEMMLVADDQQSFLLLSAKDILESPVEIVRNAYVYQGEQFFKVSVAKARFGKLPMAISASTLLACSACGAEHSLIGEKVVCGSCGNEC
jgi:hypothetical protein